MDEYLSNRLPRGRVFFVKQPREQFSRCHPLTRAAAAHKPEELRAISVGPPAEHRLEDPLARAGQVLPALLVYDCREVQCLRDAGTVGAVELFIERLGDRGLGLGLLPAFYCFVPGDLGFRKLLLPCGLPPGARQLLCLGKRLAIK